MEVPGPEAVRDRVGGQPGGEQLLSRDDSVPAIRDGKHFLEQMSICRCHGTCKSTSVRVPPAGATPTPA
jgi:hypothetical protein